ncbi:hypothetical protein V8D89_006921 [Ganoderma adspersum]
MQHKLRIDLFGATTDELDALEKACHLSSALGDKREPAPFGRNDQTVFDDSYRKAGKMEVDDFMLGFDAERTGLIEAIRSSLFQGAEEEKFIKAELYKLNVYDTPRAENMFGSLVVVLPTPHEDLYFSPTRTSYFSTPSSGLRVLHWYLQRLEDRYGYECRKEETARLSSKTVHMVTEMTTFNELKSTMIMNMGNDAGLYHMYKYVCLLVDVGPAGKQGEIRTSERKKI